MRAECHVRNDVLALGAQHRFIWTHIALHFVQERGLQHDPQDEESQHRDQHVQAQLHALPKPG